jgi:hypothetical protein
MARRALTAGGYGPLFYFEKYIKVNATQFQINKYETHTAVKYWGQNDATMIGRPTTIGMKNIISPMFWRVIIIPFSTVLTNPKRRAL